MMQSISTTLLSATSLLLPPNPSSPVDTFDINSPLLKPHTGAPLSNDPSLIPLKYRIQSEYPNSDWNSTGTTTALHPKIGLVRSPPSTLLDAPTRAALNMPNAYTADGQARAMRGEYDSNDAGSSSLGGRGDTEEITPLISPSPKRLPSTSSYLSPRTPSFLGRTNSHSTSTRPSSAGSNAHPNTGLGGGGILRRIFDRPSTPSSYLSKPTFPPPSLSTYSPLPFSPLSRRAKIHLFISQTISILLSTVFLAGVVSWALVIEIKQKLPQWVYRTKGSKKFPWDDDRYWRKEGRKISKDPGDYARQIGMDIEDQVVETEDGYYLKMHKVIDPTHKPTPSGKPPFPVLILHGLFQSSGSFVTSEERSLAFWLARQGGYSVYLGNTRGVFDMGHRSFRRNDPRFWDWTIRELAMYDLPALVEHVCRETGYDKIAFIGHSQGNGLAFISLSLGMCPNIGKKLSVFIALAPAVYAGPLTTGFPFTALNRIEWSTWKRLFGVLDFIPLMRWSYDYAPAKLFAMLGYTMFAFLFSWTDTNWLSRRKTKMFRFTPTPVSSASIFWWCGKGGFADRKCTLDDTLDRWFDDRFPPLSIYYGGKDYLVLTEPLLERLEKKERDVEVVKVTKLDLSEHCDFYWAAEAVEWAYESFVDDIERTRPRDKDGQ